MCKELSELEIGWAAGLLEGEGCFGWYGDYNGYPLVSVCSVDKDVIEKFSKLFEGTFRETHPTSKGKRVWEWRVTSKNAIICMQKVLPHMSKRRADKIVNCILKWLELEDNRKEEKDLREIQCRKGHLYGEDGYYIGKTKSGNSEYKICKTCSKEWAKTTQENKRKKGVEST